MMSTADRGIALKFSFFHPRSALLPMECLSVALKMFAHHKMFGHNAPVSPVHITHEI